MKKNDLFIHNIASKYILGENINIEIKGNKQQLQTLNELLDISKLLYNSLQNKNIPLSKIMNLVEQKKKLSDQFTKLTNIQWKL